jgi:organic radical activating enzyme
MEGIIAAWGRIIRGYTPAMSIEITRECPLHCPGCYAYGDDHLGGGGLTLRTVRDFKGQELVDGVMALVDKHRPLHVSIVGGEPLVRYRELQTILPELAKRNIHSQLVTSAVREIPREFNQIHACRSSSPSTASSPSTTSAARRPPTIASRSTSSVTRSRCTAR